MTDAWYGLSKSKLTAFEQCPRKLWLSKFKPEVERPDDGAEGRFAMGHEVGDLACALIPTGVMVHADPDLSAAVVRTRELLDGGWREPIFEATFEYDGVLVRIDVLSPNDRGWSIAEVKSSASVKDYHLGDLATQVWVVGMSGLSLTSASIRHIDTGFRLEKEGDYNGLFHDADRLDAIATHVTDRPELVRAARETLAKAEPEVETGDHCSDPFPCGFADYCSLGGPPQPKWPISLLPQTGKKIAASWAAKGKRDLGELPQGALKNTSHERIREATVTGLTYRDQQGAIEAVADWAFPRAYLDFETINLAIPRWLGTRPFQQIPFQYSCHVEASDGSLVHSAFLSIDGKDPRRACAEALIGVVGGDACRSIIAYSSPFERRCVRELGEAFPDLHSALSEIESKIVDLLPVTRANYYHRDQRGSWSIKAVLPTVAPELAYDDLDVKDGGAAQKAWLEAIRDDTSEHRRSELRAGLESYCERDTEAMVVLLRRLIGADETV